MSIFTRPRPAVKPSKAPHPSRPFGEGILPPQPARFVPSDADLAWAEAELNRHALDFDIIGVDRIGADDRAYDMLAAEVLAEDAMERGLIPSDVARYIESTSLVGHPA